MLCWNKKCSTLMFLKSDYFWLFVPCIDWWSVKLRGTKKIDHVKSVVIGVSELLKLMELGCFEMRVPYNSYNILNIIANFSFIKLSIPSTFHSSQFIPIASQNEFDLVFKGAHGLRLLYHLFFPFNYVYFVSCPSSVSKLVR